MAEDTQVADAVTNDAQADGAADAQGDAKDDAAGATEPTVEALRAQLAEKDREIAEKEKRFRELSDTHKGVAETERQLAEVMDPQTLKAFKGAGYTVAQIKGFIEEGKEQAIAQRRAADAEEDAQPMTRAEMKEMLAKERSQSAYDTEAAAIDDELTVIEDAPLRRMVRGAVLAELAEGGFKNGRYASPRQVHDAVMVVKDKLLADSSDDGKGKGAKKKGATAEEAARLAGLPAAGSATDGARAPDAGADTLEKLRQDVADALASGDINQLGIANAKLQEAKAALAGT